MNRCSETLKVARLLLATIPVVAFLAQMQLATASSTTASNISVDPHSIVVLPTEVLTNDPRAPELATKAYEELLRQLATLQDLNVVERERAAAFAGSELAPEEVARQLGAAAILQSSIQAQHPYFALRTVYINRQDRGTSSGSTSMVGVMEAGECPGVDPEKLLPESISRIVERLDYEMHPENRPDLQAEKVAAMTTILDTSAGDRERVDALITLAPPRMPGFPPRYARGDMDVMRGVVAITAADLGLASTDPEVRAYVWGIMTGVDDPYLTQPLMQALATDEHPGVREEAATALALFSNDDGVREALDHAYINDVDAKVRKAAHYSMLSADERTAFLERVVLDEDAPDWDRATAVHRLSGSVVMPVLLSDELTLAAAKLAYESDDARIRRMLWFSLSQGANPVLVDPLVVALAKEPMESVRQSIILSLSRYIDEPGVRQIIEETRDGDSSPLVRHAASELLSIRRE